MITTKTWLGGLFVVAAGVCGAGSVGCVAPTGADAAEASQAIEVSAPHALIVHGPGGTWRRAIVGTEDGRLHGAWWQADAGLLRFAGSTAGLLPVCHGPGGEPARCTYTFFPAEHWYFGPGPVDGVSGSAPEPSPADRILQVDRELAAGEALTMSVVDVATGEPQVIASIQLEDDAH